MLRLSGKSVLGRKCFNWAATPLIMIISVVQKFEMGLQKMSQLLHKAVSHFPPNQNNRVSDVSRETGLVQYLLMLKQDEVSTPSVGPSVRISLTIARYVSVWVALSISPSLSSTV